MNITRVQRWVASALTLTVTFVWTTGMILGALYTIDQQRDGAQIAILVMAVVINLVGLVGVRLINELRWLTPWLLVALLPSAVGAWVLAAR